MIYVLWFFFYLFLWHKVLLTTYIRYFFHYLEEEWFCDVVFHTFFLRGNFSMSCYLYRGDFVKYIFIIPIIGDFVMILTSAKEVLNLRPFIRPSVRPSFCMFVSRITLTLLIPLFWKSSTVKGSMYLRSLLAEVCTLRVLAVFNITSMAADLPCTISRIGLFKDIH